MLSAPPAQAKPRISSKPSMLTCTHAIAAGCSSSIGCCPHTRIMVDTTDREACPKTLTSLGVKVPHQLRNICTSSVSEAWGANACHVCWCSQTLALLPRATSSKGISDAFQTAIPQRGAAHPLAFVLAYHAAMTSTHYAQGHAQDSCTTRHGRLWAYPRRPPPRWPLGEPLRHPWRRRAAAQPVAAGSAGCLRPSGTGCQASCPAALRVHTRLEQAAHAW